MEDFHRRAAESREEQAESASNEWQRLVQNTAREMDVSNKVSGYILHLEKQIKDLGGEPPARP